MADNQIQMLEGFENVPQHRQHQRRRRSLEGFDQGFTTGQKVTGCLILGGLLIFAIKRRQDPK